MQRLAETPVSLSDDAAGRTDSLAKKDDGPGQETASALGIPKRDFDGGLLERWQFTLTRADALAYLRLRREWSDRAKVGFAVVCIAGGGLAGLLPGYLLWAFLAVEAALIAAIFAGRDLVRRRRAFRLVPVPRPAVLEEWTDCIAGTEIGSADEAYLSPELIGEVLLTPTHLFILGFDTVIAVPRTAFADAEEAEATAAHFKSLACGPYYFEA